MTARHLIGIDDVEDAALALEQHAKAAVSKRRHRGLPTCGDAVGEDRKFTALVEEVGEVARAIQDGSLRAVLHDELLDVATAALLWAWAIRQEGGI